MSVPGTRLRLLKSEFLEIGETEVIFSSPNIQLWVFPMTQLVKNLPAMQETQVRSLGQEDPLEEGMETHSSILA